MRSFFTHIRRALPHLLALCFVVGMCAIAGDALAQQKSPSIAPTPSSSLFGISDKLGTLFNNGMAWVAIGILSLFAWLTGIAGVLLNFSISYLVVGMGELVLNGGFGVTIGALWDIIRNLVNLTFIFSIVYLAMMTIVQGSTSNVKRALASIIISMLLVNFSLYFAKAVIDVGNLTAFTIYHQMVGQTTQDTAYLNDPSYGIASVFADRLGATIFLSAGSSGGSRDKILEAAVKEGGLAFIILYTLGGSILLFKLAVAFALGAFILIIRFVMLILLMITSPVAFLPADLPMIGKYRDQWWKTLISQSFVAPVYLFGIYLSLLVLTNMPYQSKDGLAALFTGGGATNMKGALSTLLFYVIAIVMIIGATMMAKSMSSSGAIVTQTLFKNFATRAVGSYAGRRTIGRIADKLNSPTSRIGRVFTQNRLLGRQAQSFLKKTAESKFGGSYSYKDDKAFAKELRKRESTYERDTKLAGALQKWEKDKNNLALRKEAAKAVGGITSTELEEQSLDELKKIALLLSNSQMDKIKDSKEIPESEKSAVKLAREAAQKAAYVHSPEDFLKEMKPQDRAKIATDIINGKTAKPDDVLTYMNGDTVRRMHADNTLSEPDAHAFAKRMRTVPTADKTGLGYINSPRGQEYYGMNPKAESKGGGQQPSQGGQSGGKQQQGNPHPQQGYREGYTWVASGVDNRGHWRQL